MTQASSTSIHAHEQPQLQPLAGGSNHDGGQRPPVTIFHTITYPRNAMLVLGPPDEPDPDRPARRLPLVDSGDWWIIRERPGQQRQDDHDDDQHPALDPRFPLPHMPSGGAAILLSITKQQAQHSGAFFAGSNGGGQDWHPFDYIVFDDPDEEFVFPVIPIQIDDELHTAENNYCCGDPTCDCSTAEEAL